MIGALAWVAIVIGGWELLEHLGRLWVDHQRFRREFDRPRFRVIQGGRSHVHPLRLHDWQREGWGA